MMTFYDLRITFICMRRILNSALNDPYQNFKSPRRATDTHIMARYRFFCPLRIWKYCTLSRFYLFAWDFYDYGCPSACAIRLLIAILPTVCVVLRRGPPASVCCVNLGVLANRILGRNSLFSLSFTHSIWYVFVCTQLIDTVLYDCTSASSNWDIPKGICEKRSTDRPLGLRIQLNKTHRYL